MTNIQGWNYNPFWDQVKEASYSLAGTGATFLGLSQVIGYAGAGFTVASSFATSYCLKKESFGDSSHSLNSNIPEERQTSLLNAFDKIISKAELSENTSLYITDNRRVSRPYANLVHNSIRMPFEMEKENPEGTEFLIGHEASHLKVDRTNLWGEINQIGLTLGMMIAPLAAGLDIAQTGGANTPELTLLAGTGFYLNGKSNKVAENRADRNGLFLSQNIESARSFMSSFSYSGLSGLWRRLTMPSPESRQDNIETAWEDMTKKGFVNEPF